MHRPTAIVTACALALVMAVGITGCGGPDQPQVQGPAPTRSPAAGPVYVSDTMGHPLIRPTRLGLTEFTSLSHLKWRDWGQPKAVATGEVSGMWCIPGCEKTGYPATVELSGLQRQENVSYYTRASVRSAHLPNPAETGEDLRSVHLYAPEP
ncbi:hypothetical protein ACH4YO_02370 [Streptomyces noursei]|uniref:hypothetical protein n=1 Tax=Streptomyces noursei TaxID=1971 RepID=UPI00081CAEE3|nr:hypothetical protein [Streptomyces noursei]ANZ21492.1 hypothetical protein SNOUR_41320 [Streptomyces noursei ATCC 11455]MCZ1020952.1 hypothetical protein [Streptomyces noursei]GGX35245.1 hypothetical protein GCM10010341_65980 [Streptomyces noursei]